MNSTLMFKVTFSTVTALFFTISKFEIIYLFYTIKNEIITSLKTHIVQYSIKWKQKAMYNLYFLIILCHSFMVRLISYITMKKLN